MFGNLTSVTAEPARTPAPSVPSSDTGRSQAAAAIPGKGSSSGGEELPVLKATTLDVERAVERLNELSSGNRRNLHFRVDEQSGRTIITVINAATREVVRQIPAEEVLAIVRELEHSGSLIDVQA